MPVPFKVKAVYEYKSEEPDDLNFPNGQIITVTEEEDEDWYTGEYTDASGSKLEGIFPRNFVEKYEPAIPSRPVRQARPIPAETRTQDVPPPTSSNVTSIENTPLQEAPAATEISRESTKAAPSQPDQKPVANIPAQSSESKPAASKAAPPPVAEKPSGNSFRDRIAAFNKPAASPVTPFKTGGGTGFVKKAFVAPPPSRNAYVPPPTQPATQKNYRREDDASIQKEDEQLPRRDDVVRSGEQVEEDQPKPTSLKDRIALLQQQQLEQAAKAAEKKKPKKSVPQRTDSGDNFNETSENTETPLTRQATGDTLGRKSVETSHVEEPDSLDDTDEQSHEPAIPTAIPPPLRELVSDTNDADDSGAGDTEEAPSTEEERHQPVNITSPTQAAAKVEKDDEAEDEEDTEDEDPEIKRRRELRERMAKMSGGMGMMGMFGGGIPAPSKKAKAPRESEYTSDVQPQEEMSRAPPIPVMALPGMAQIPRQTEPEPEDEEDEEVEPVSKDTTRYGAVEDGDTVGRPSRSSTDRTLPQSPREQATRDARAAPPPPPASAPSIPSAPRSPPSRPVPPPPPTTAVNRTSMESTGEQPPQPPMRQPSIKIATQPGVPPRIPSRQSTNESLAQAPGVPPTDKRASRAAPPPIPGSGPASPQSRAPPPPPGQPPSRRATGSSQGLTSPIEANDDDDSEAEVTEYDGDYDTDIASSAKHKEALKSHHREISMDDEETFTDEAAQQASSPPTRAVPPLPPTMPPRDVPPPPPQTAPKSRKSVEAPRNLPPPIPMSRPDDDGEYDPYNHASPQHGLPTPPIRSPQSPPLRASTRDFEDEDMYSAPSQPPPRIPPPPSGSIPPIPTERMPPPPPLERTAPPPPPIERAAPPPPPTGPLPAIPTMTPSMAAPPPPHQSLDVARQPSVRRSQDVNRPSTDYGFIASDLDLSETSGWWTYDHTPPPSVQGRPDILYEVESNTTTKRGGKTTITRDIYVLYSDHSQTTINVAFDPAEPAHASFQQSHERPPPPPRQDQLESASTAFGSQIAKTAASASGKEIGDGTAQSFVQELIRPFQSSALMPIGTRTYGALVYANLANASTQQFDEIRPGDIVTFRNAKFAGHKGGLHAKYSMDVGKPDHVGIVIDWDGTKKKIRAYEQGRDEKGKKMKVKEESFRVGDLKSGEVRVWRVMPRGWVGWDKS